MDDSRITYGYSLYLFTNPSQKLFQKSIGKKKFVFYEELLKEIAKN